MKKFTVFASVLCSVIALSAMMLLGSTPAAATLALDSLSSHPETGMLFVGAGLVINRASMTNLFISFKALFQGALTSAEPMYKTIATEVPSTTKTQAYPWLGAIPGMRKWIGDRVINNLATHKYEIENEKFEDTIAVDRESIEDDNHGVYSPLFTEFGNAVAAWPDELCFEALKNGFTSLCYDGQYMFDTDHPVLDANGDVTSVANTDGGAGAPWFLMDDTRAIKPIIFQNRYKPDFTPKDNYEDDNVFHNDEFLYGSRARGAAGYGLWQLCWGSKQTLNAANLQIARDALFGLKGDHGRPLRVRPRKLVVGTANLAAAEALIDKERLAGGEDNPWYKKFEIVHAPWLD